MKIDSPSLDRRNLVVMSAAGFLLAGCGGVSLLAPGNAPEQIYMLSPTMQPLTGTKPANGEIAIALPETSSSFATHRIAIVRGDVLDYYADAQWTDPAPQLLQSLLVEAFEKIGGMVGVAKESEGLKSDYIIQSVIRDFDARYDNTNPAAIPIITVDVLVRVASTKHGTILGAHSFRQEVSASANSIPAAVNAFDGALSNLLPQIVAWAMETAKG